MHSAKLVAASAALFGYAAAASTCTKDIKVTEPTPAIDCEVVDANIEVKSGVEGGLQINGPKQIKGDLKIDTVPGIISISSPTINSIQGTFTLKNLTGLHQIDMDSLRSINELEMETLPHLNGLTFGSEGVTKASTVTVSDTSLNSLSGLKLATVDTLSINNNGQLTKFDSDLVNITKTLIINDNGRDMKVSMDKLENAAEVQIRNAKSFEVPSLKQLNASLKLDSCDNLKSFIAPNLTKVTDAVSFINNKQLKKLSLPKLEEVSGDLRVVNNTKLSDLDGFPKLDTIKGGVKLGGNFDKVKMPKLKVVKGVIDVSSTTDISDFCDFFNNLDVSNAKTTCKSNDKSANEGADDGDLGGDGSSGSKKDDEDDGAGIVNVNTALMGLALLAGIAQLL